MKIKDQMEREKTEKLHIAEQEYLGLGYKYTDEKKEHLHTFNGRPLIGTSTVVKTAFPFSNLYWASGMAVGIFGWVNPRYNSPEERSVRAKNALETIKTLGVEEYIELLDKAYKAHAEKRDLAAEAGTDAHALLEGYVKECIKEQYVLAYLGENRIVRNFAEWSAQNVSKFLASEVHTFSLKKWLGGIVDCVAIMKDGKTAILDFKSAKEAYDAHFFQIAGYDVELRESGGYSADGRKILKKIKADEYIVVPFGAEKLVPEYRYNVKQLRAVFGSLLKTYKCLKNL